MVSLLLEKCLLHRRSHSVVQQTALYIKGAVCIYRGMDLMILCACVCCVCVHVRDSHTCALVGMTEVVRRGMKVGAVARRRKSARRRMHK